MILETEAFKFVEAFSGWWLLAPVVIAIIFFAIGFLLKQRGYYYDDAGDGFIIGGIVSIIMGTVFTTMAWGLSGDHFNEAMFAEDTGKLGFEQVKVIQNEEEFVGSLDGKFVTCAMLETDVEFKYKVLCDN